MDSQLRSSIKDALERSSDDLHLGMMVHIDYYRRQRELIEFLKNNLKAQGALNAYKKDDFKVINNALRNNSFLNENMKYYIENIDLAFEYAPKTTDTIILFRGNSRLLDSETIIPTYLSTTNFVKGTMSFVPMRKTCEETCNRCCVYAFIVPPGMPYIYMETIEELLELDNVHFPPNLNELMNRYRRLSFEERRKRFKNFDYVSNGIEYARESIYEAEILLPRNLRYEKIGEEYFNITVENFMTKVNMGHKDSGENFKLIVGVLHFDN